jgi:hypothetical protein
MPRSAANASAVHQNGTGAKEVHTLSTGVRVTLSYVPSMLIQEAQYIIPDPPVPQIFLEKQNRVVDNPNDPAYAEALEAAKNKRTMAAFDVMISFGVKLADGLPKDESWLKQLRRVGGRGSVNLADYDLTDKDDLEFLYLRFVAFQTSEDFNILNKVIISEADVQERVETFPSN